MVSLPVAAEVEILGGRLRGKCAVISDFPYDVLLGAIFLKRTSLVIDFQSLTLVNPGPPKHVVAAFFLVYQCYKILNVNTSQCDWKYVSDVCHLRHGNDATAITVSAIGQCDRFESRALLQVVILKSDSILNQNTKFEKTKFNETCLTGYLIILISSSVISNN